MEGRIKLKVITRENVPVTLFETDRDYGFKLRLAIVLSEKGYEVEDDSFPSHRFSRIKISVKLNEDEVRSIINEQFNPDSIDIEFKEYKYYE